ncbi:MAG: hypothetical protein LE178_05550, partial [Endomicrobium sp.]|nr:hypothetical protein [Endomicrobium sp.]
LNFLSTAHPFCLLHLLAEPALSDSIFEATVHKAVLAVADMPSQSVSSFDSLVPRLVPVLSPSGSVPPLFPSVGLTAGFHPSVPLPVVCVPYKLLASSELEVSSNSEEARSL